MSDTCNFCRTLTVLKFAEEKPFPDGSKLEYEYRAALVSRCWVKGHKRGAGRMTDYMRAGRGYPLNYCPECGRPLRKTKEQDNDII